MHRSHVSVLFSALLLLAGLGLGSDVAATPMIKSGKSGKSGKSVTSKEVIEIELREYEGSKPAANSRELTLPLHGELTGWMELFGEARLCRSKSSPTHDELIVIELECRADDRAGQLVFELRVERELGVDDPTLLGEIETREGQRLSVVATRR
jgi:hypothetical protein